MEFTIGARERLEQLVRESPRPLNEKLFRSMPQDEAIRHIEERAEAASPRQNEDCPSGQVVHHLYDPLDGLPFAAVSRNCSTSPLRVCPTWCRFWAA